MKTADADSQINEFNWQVDCQNKLKKKVFSHVIFIDCILIIVQYVSIGQNI